MAKDEIHAFLGANTVFEGTLRFTGTVRIDGSFSGEIYSESALIIGASANVQGKVQVASLIVSGTFKGESRVQDKVLLQKKACYEGVLYTNSLQMEEGALYEGTLHMKQEVVSYENS